MSRSPLCRLIHAHLDAIRHYEEVLNQFLVCGDSYRRVTLLKCDQCGHDLTVPFSS